eukprot:GILI01026032.1.p1 GENE.GILI01026032.1~~GILI01026032.1.p1  ORF type:complete len:482 (-),score=69.62 GILI01026032.1:945-2258(-)
MWQGVQAAHQLYVPTVDTSVAARNTLKHQIISMAFSKESASSSRSLASISANTRSLMEHRQALPMSFSPVRAKASDEPPRQRQAIDLIDIGRRSAEIRRQHNQRYGNPSVLDVSRLDGLTTSEMIANAYFQKKRLSGAIPLPLPAVGSSSLASYSQTMILNLLVGGLPYHRLIDLAPHQRALLNECLLLDLASIMIPANEDGQKAGGEKNATSSPKTEGTTADGEKGSSKRREDVNLTRGRSASRKGSPLKKVKLDDVGGSEERGALRIDGEAKVASDGMGSEPIQVFAYNGGAYTSSNVLTVPVDVAILGMDLHHPTQGITVSVRIEPSKYRYNRKEVFLSHESGGFPSASIDSQLRQQRIIQEVYVPRLLKAVADASPANIQGGLVGGGLRLPMLEGICHQRGLLLQSSGAGIHRAHVRLLDVAFSLTTHVGSGK